MPLLRGHHRRPDPGYLRIAVLNRFTDNEWSSGDRDVPTDNLADGRCRRSQGVASTVPHRATTTTCPCCRLRLHLAADPGADLPDRRRAGDWRYDPSTMDFIAGDDGPDAPRACSTR